MWWEGKHLHFIGIGGIGMSAIAEVLCRQGVRVSGCDMAGSSITAKLARLGIDVRTGHDPAHLDGVDAVVMTDAIAPDNAELLAAKERLIPVVRRTQALADLMAGRRGIAVSGTHGKTTTTAMIAAILATAGEDPMVLVGGEYPPFGGNARVGAGAAVVVEACEAYNGFLDLSPEIVVITNVEAEHLDYHCTVQELVEAFRLFVARTPPQGRTVLCADCPELASLAEKAGSPVIWYGFATRADYRGVAARPDDGGVRFDLEVRGARRGPVHVGVPGEHNAQNALAALAVTLELGVNLAVAARALAEYHGVRRRFELIGEAAGVTILDDYAHHPTEIRATLRAVRERYPGRMIVIFQPHLYSRTLQFADGFADALLAADRIILTDI